MDLPLMARLYCLSLPFRCPERATRRPQMDRRLLARGHSWNVTLCRHKGAGLPGRETNQVACTTEDGARRSTDSGQFR